MSAGRGKTLSADSVKAYSGVLFDALTSVSGLAVWWTRVTGSGDVGGERKFFFESPDPCVMHVDQPTRPALVEWTVTDCSFLPDWVGTRPTFTITPVDGDASELQFRHHGLTPELDCIEMCTRGWDHFIEKSLREYVEVGQRPPPGGARVLGGPSVLTRTEMASKDEEGYSPANSARSCSR